MTEERLIEIVNQHGGYESQTWALEAMKQAVNEAIQECVDKAEVKFKIKDSVVCIIDARVHHADWEAFVHEPSLLKLMVK